MLETSRRVFVFGIDESQTSSTDGRFEVIKWCQLVSSCWMEYPTRGSHILILKSWWWSETVSLRNRSPRPDYAIPYSLQIVIQFLDVAARAKATGHFRPVVWIPQTPDIISLSDAVCKYPKYPWFCILSLEFGVNIDIHKHKNSVVLCSNRNKSPKVMFGNSRLQIHGNMLIDFIWLYVQTK